MACVLLFVAGKAAGQEESPPEVESKPAPSAHDYADLGASRLTDPASDLFLSETGRRKGEALSLYFKGLFLQEELKIAEAVEAFRESVRRDPSNVDLAMETANLSAAQGEFDEALALLDESLEKNPLNPEAWLHVSQFCETYGSSSEKLKGRALEQAAATYERFPYDIDVIRHYANILVGRSERDKAAEVMEQTLKLPERHARFWLSVARIARNVWPMSGSEENRGKVNAIYEKALEHAEGDDSVAEKVADHYSASRQFEAAERLYSEIIDRNPSALRTREKLVRVYKETGKSDAALKTLIELVQIDPHRAKTQKLIATMYRDLGNIDKAIEHYEALLRIQPGDEELCLELAAMLQEEERWEEAVELLERAHRIHPRSIAVVGELASLYLYIKQPSKSMKAHAALEKLAEEEGETLTAEFYHWYGVAAERAGEHERAAELFRRSIELVDEDGKPEDAAETLNYLGYMWLELDRHIDEAGELIRRANELKPDVPEYIDSLGWFYFKKQEYGKALEALLRAADGLAKPDAVVFDHIAQTYFQLGKREDALEYVGKALELEPSSEEYKRRQQEYEAAGAEAGESGEAESAR